MKKNNSLSAQLVLKNALIPIPSIQPRRKRANEKTLEEATRNNNFNYKLSNEDILNIAYIKYNNFQHNNEISLSDFSIIENVEQLVTQIYSFQLKTLIKPCVFHTLLVNLGIKQWVSIVFSYQNELTKLYYIDPSGNLLTEDYLDFFQEFHHVIDLSSYIKHESVEIENFSLLSLENSALIKQMLDNNESLEWLISNLKIKKDTEYFISLRKFCTQLIKINSLRIKKNLVLRSYDNNQPSTSKKTESVLDISEPLVKRPRLFSATEDINKYLEVFVHEFTINFVKRLSLYHLTAKGQQITQEEIFKELKTGATGALVGIGIAQSIMGSIPSIIASVRSLSSHYFTSKTKAQTITRIFYSIEQPPIDEILSKAAIQTFKNYAYQFMEITDKAGDKMAISKLAEDAAGRCLNFIAEDKQSNLIISEDLITTGVVAGPSEKFFDPSIKNKRLRVSGSKIQDRSGNNINTANLYEKTGIRILNQPPKTDQFYRLKINLDSSTYGYRLPFNWEVNSQGQLNELMNENYCEDPILVENENKFQYVSRRYEHQVLEIKLKETTENILLNLKNPTQIIKESAVKLAKKSILFNLRSPINNFFGRHHVLHELHQLLSKKNIGVVTQLTESLSLGASSSKSTQCLTSICGLGGIGKTQLVLKYAQVYADSYGNNVIWINAETKNAILICLKNLASELKIKINDDYGNPKNIEELIQETYKHFSTENSLFIFDNVENFRQFSNLLPHKIIGSTPTLLITSRYSNWKNVAPTLSLDIFTEVESIDFIIKELSLSEEPYNPIIKSLALLLQGLPLALQQAVCYIKLLKNVNPQFSINDYIQQFKKESEKVLNFDYYNYNNDPYIKTVYVTWQISLERIKQEPMGGTALEVISIMSYLEPEHIASQLFLPLYEPQNLASAIDLLRSYSMINQQNTADISTIHRMVQQILRINIEKDSAQFLKIAELTLKVTESPFNNLQKELHHIFFLLYMSQHSELMLILNLGQRRRIFDILLFSQFDISLINLYDNAYTLFQETNFYSFVAEAFNYFIDNGLLLSLTETTHYLETKINEGIITRDSIRNIAQNRFDIAQGSKSHWLSAEEDVRIRQMDALALYFEFIRKILPEGVEYCSSRKKRAIKQFCLSSEIPFTPKKITHNELINRLQLAAKITQFASTGLITKDILSDLLQGKLQEVGMNLALITSSIIFDKISDELLLKGNLLSSTAFADHHISLKGKLSSNILFYEGIESAKKINFLSNSLMVSSAFVKNGLPISSLLYYLTKQIYTLPNSNHSKLSLDFISNSLMAGLNLAQSSIKAGEYLEIIEDLSEIVDPEIEIANLAIWLINSFDKSINRIKNIEKYVHLSPSEIGWQMIRSLANYPVSGYLEIKSLNTHLVKEGIGFLKTHPEFEAYFFPSAYSSKELHRHNNIFLRKKILLTAFATMPDPPLEGKIIGLSGFNDSKPGAQNNTQYFLCDNAMGVARNQKSSNGIYVIALGEGNDKALAPLEKSTIFYVYNGTKTFIGGDQDNLFIIADVGVSGCITGGKKDNLLKLVDLLTTSVLGSLIDNSGMLCFQPLPLLVKQCQTGLKLNRIHKIFGRHNQSDTLYSNENITFIDSLGGKNSFERDHIYITQHTLNNLQIILRPNTVISYFESILLPTTIFYNLTIDQEGESWLHLNFQKHLLHQFYLNFPLDSFKKMTKEFLSLIFKFSYQQKNFNLTFSTSVISNYNQIELNFFKNTVFVFNNNVLVRFFKKNYLYIKENNNFTINTLLSIYAPLAKRWGINLKLFLHKEVLIFGSGNQEILSNDPVFPTALMGQSGETIYRILGQTTQFPLNPINIYDRRTLSNKKSILDFTEIWKNVKELCSDQKAYASISALNEDLIIRIDVTYQVDCIAVKNWTVVNVILKEACITHWQQHLNVVFQRMPYMIVTQENGGWRFEKYPLVFDHTKDIILLTEYDLRQKQEIILLQQAEEISIYCHNQTDLIVMNAKSIHDSPSLIIYSQFYTDIPSQENALSSKLKFFNKEISLKSIINNSKQNCTDFNILIKKLNQLFFNQSEAINSTFTEIFNRSKRAIDTNNADNDYQPHQFHLQIYRKKEARTVTFTFRFSLNSLIYGSTAACLKEISLRYRHRYTSLPNVIDYIIQPTLFAAHSLNWRNSFQIPLYLVLNYIFTQLSIPIISKCKILNFLFSILTLTLVLNPSIFMQEDRVERFISEFCSNLMDGVLFKIGECGTHKLVSYFFKQRRPAEENFTEINHYYPALTE
ncbi:hypothetical protein [Rickettsiella endosymbiont of Rhagonycha lignosa]|uniref:hypothetical protein n=1 Tax=Rickettsiella endosymbiont of Rhagonycha lignosa TaxID=3077937 RepID=UPI00313D56E3